MEHLPTGSFGEGQNIKNALLKTRKSNYSKNPNESTATTSLVSVSLNEQDPLEISKYTGDYTETTRKSQIALDRIMELPVAS